jgi:Zn-dependent M28 family amino/carboxypeptidase
MTLRDFGFYLRGRLNRSMSHVINGRRRPAPLPPAAALKDVVRGPASPLALTRLLEGRSNAARQGALAEYLQARDIPFERHSFATFEGAGDNFTVDIGTGDRVLLLAAHHDAVPGSPGANDNAASVAILLNLRERVLRSVRRGLRVRLLFAACEELGYLGARHYVRQLGVAGIAGVLSLELCGVGDSLAVWDAGGETPFLSTVRGAFDGLGLRSDESYHVVGRIPVFGSDHRAFAAAGVPAYGLTVIPRANAEPLREFIFRPVRGAILNLTHRPVPFDTYHTSRDASATLDPAALESVVTALEAVIAEMGTSR